jgi:tRNA-specific 2-thiouridylase
MLTIYTIYQLMINSLGFSKTAKNTKVVVAMSGGVDSSVVAGLMKEEGYDVTGITLKLYDDSKTSKEGRQCCAGQDILDAKRVSEHLGINHKILFYQKKFKEEVIDSFIDSYVAGETPIPCVQCNQTVKFRDLFKYAKELNADALITGHYVTRLQNNGKANMYRAKDSNRDQSYFLFSTTQEQLDYLRFPLGKIEKEETRDIANKLNLNVAHKPDSQDICFVPNGDYSSVIKKFRPESFRAGDILDLSGKKLGEHKGIINYTIGQRKGIKISSTDPLYVVNIDADNNQIIVGPKESLVVQKIELKNLNILGNKKEFGDFISIKVRSTGKLLKAKINIKNNSAIVNIIDGEAGISPGQACVFYLNDDIGDKLLGGGWIHKTANKNLST